MGKRIDIDNLPVAGFHGGEIERVGRPRFGLDPLEILPRVKGINVNSCLGHSASVFAIPPNLQSMEVLTQHIPDERPAHR